jgi:hypothetical protein
MKAKTKRTLKTLLFAVLGIGLLVGAVSFISNLVNKEEDDGFEEIHPVFSYGGIDEDGKFVETKESLVTRELIKADEIRFILDFDSNITYKVYYYSSEYDDYVGNCDDILDSNYSETIFGGNGYDSFRIVITPKLEEDVEDKEIKWNEILKYTSQLKVEVHSYEIATLTLKDDSSYTHSINVRVGLSWSQQQVTDGEGRIVNVSYGEDGSVILSLINEAGTLRSYDLMDKDDNKVHKNQVVDLSLGYNLIQE